MNEFVDDKGFTWNPYAVHFESPEGVFAFAIYAVSHEHACLQLQSIRENAAVVGQIVAAVKS